MEIKRPGSPLDGGAEPTKRSPDTASDDDRVDFSSALGAHLGQLSSDAAGQAGESASGSSAGSLRAALAEIASASDLSDAEGAAAAVRQSARSLVLSALGEAYVATGQHQRAVEEIGEHLVSDPFMKAKLLSILTKLKSR